jgi:hypothetical protein
VEVLEVLARLRDRDGELLLGVLEVPAALLAEGGDLVARGLVLGREDGQLRLGLLELLGDVVDGGALRLERGLELVGALLRGARLGGLLVQGGLHLAQGGAQGRDLLDDAAGRGELGLEGRDAVAQGDARVHLLVQLALNGLHLGAVGALQLRQLRLVRLLGVRHAVRHGLGRVAEGAGVGDCGGGRKGEGGGGKVRGRESVVLSLLRSIARCTGLRRAAPTTAFGTE